MGEGLGKVSWDNVTAQDEGLGKVSWVNVTAPDEGEGMGRGDRGIG